MNNCQNNRNTKFKRSERELDVLNQFFPERRSVYDLNNRTLFQYLSGSQNESQINKKLIIYDRCANLHSEEVFDLACEYPISGPNDFIFLKLAPEDCLQPHVVFDETSLHKYWLLKSKTAPDFKCIFNENNAISGILWAVERGSDKTIVINALICFKKPVSFLWVEKGSRMLYFGREDQL